MGVTDFTKKLSYTFQLEQHTILLCIVVLLAHGCPITTTDSFILNY